MKETKTYNIEELLENKTYEELTVDEREFVNQQIDTPQEFAEMKATLLSIKKIAKQQNTISPLATTKEHLMKMMKGKENRKIWFSLNGIANFLFPSNVPLFKKPGLQFATLAMLLLLVVNIGWDQLSTPKELAVNTTTKDLSAEPNRVERNKNTPEISENNNFDIELEEISTENELVFVPEPVILNWSFWEKRNVE